VRSIGNAQGETPAAPQAEQPPQETILSNVVGEFLDPIDALFAIFFSILFALLFTLSYGILIYNGVIPSYFGRGYGRQLFVTIVGRHGLGHHRRDPVRPGGNSRTKRALRLLRTVRRRQ